MCGITGVLGKRDDRLIKRMNAALYHRGPDSEGYFHSADIDLGMRRLSIIDLVSGDQPIFNATRDKCIIFNGEIYNYRELRSELLEKGYTFETATDTEVIIHLYEEYGERCVEHLRGMFAFAIADGEKLFLARDRLGIKPLYYAHLKEHGSFIFASEIKALLQCAELHLTINRQAMADRLVLGYAFDDETVFEEIRFLRPGHYMHVSKRADEIEIKQQQYYRLSIAPETNLPLETAEERLMTLLRDGVGSHLIADVEVGLTLSGGLDSSLLALVMKEYYGDQISTFTIADMESSPDLRQSRKIARHVKSNHDEILMDYDDYVKAISGCLLAEEQPTSLFGLPFFLLCKRISSRVKVCLNGEGADELFGGYPEYFDRISKLISIRNGLATAREFELPVRDEVAAVVEALSSATNSDEYLRRLFYLNLTDQLVRFHLEMIDKYSMASSLEIRVPFLDNLLVDFANTLPLGHKVNREVGVGKYILKLVAVKQFGPILLDAALRRKIGFPASGLNHFARFNDLCEANLPVDYAEKHEMNPFYLFKERDGRTTSFKRDLLLFDLFSFIFIDQRGVLPQGFDVFDFIKEKSTRLELVEK
jgi:asparagine synthase (glutamine-hydrolysing)